MTTLTQTRPLVHTGESLLSRMLARYRHWADVRATRVALMQLSDRELADIGLSRGDIEAVATRA